MGRYRAPELLFGARQYDYGVDLWAVGAIVAEMLTGRPAFCGDNDIDQLFRVASVLGSPAPDVWPEVEELPDFRKVSFPDMPAVPLEEALEGVPPPALALLSRLLRYRSVERGSAAEAHEGSSWFASHPAAEPFDVPPRASADLIDRLS